MKILWSIPIPASRQVPGRGDVVRAHNLIAGLRALGHDIHVVDDGDRPAANVSVSAYRSVIKRLLPQKPALMLRDAGRWLNGRAFGRHVAAQARMLGSQVIVETQVNFSSSGAVASRLAGVPLVLDDCGPSSEERVLGAGLPGLCRSIHAQQTAAAARVVAVSTAMGERLASEGVAAAKISFVPNGVDTQAYVTSDRLAARRRLGLEEKLVIGFVGSFQPWHRVDMLISALDMLSAGVNAHLLLVGSGQELPTVLEMVSSRGLKEQVTSIGEVPPDQVSGLIPAFDIGVVPGSNDYGNPMKLFDYAAAGLAILAPDLPPVREVIDDGETGILFTPDDVSALAAALTRLARDEDLRLRLGTSARRIAAGISWIDRARALEAVAREAIASAS